MRGLQLFPRRASQPGRGWGSQRGRTWSGGGSAGPGRCREGRQRGSQGGRRRCSARPSPPPPRPSSPCPSSSRVPRAGARSAGGSAAVPRPSWLRALRCCCCCCRRCCAAAGPPPSRPSRPSPSPSRPRCPSRRCCSPPCCSPSSPATPRTRCRTSWAASRGSATPRAASRCGEGRGRCGERALQAAETAAPRPGSAEGQRLRPPGEPRLGWGRRGELAPRSGVPPRVGSAVTVPGAAGR